MLGKFCSWGIRMGNLLITSSTIKVSFVLFKRAQVKLPTSNACKSRDSLKSDVNFIKIVPEIRVGLTL